MFAERVFRIDLLEFAPDATGLVDFTEMTKGGREETREKSVSGYEENALSEKSGRCFVLAGNRYAIPRKWGYCALKSGVKTHGVLIAGIASSGCPEKMRMVPRAL